MSVIGPRPGLWNQDILTAERDKYNANDVKPGGLAWNDPEINVEWPKLEGNYRGTASAEGYSIDGIALKLSDKDQKWLGIRDTFKF